MIDSQFGFKPGRRTIDTILIIRQIIEKTREHQVPLHIHFIDFKAAFDTILREALLKMMIQIGIPHKYVAIINNLYKNTNCAIIAGGQLTDWFPAKMGVRQGCIISPSLFNIFLEHVMKGLTCLDRNLRLDDEMSIDIRYADDTTLVSYVFEKLQIVTSELENACHKWGLKINPLICANLTTENSDIKIGNSIVTKVNQFMFLGCLVPNCQDDVLQRISMAS